MQAIRVEESYPIAPTDLLDTPYSVLSGLTVTVNHRAIITT